MQRPGLQDLVEIVYAWEKQVSTSQASVVYKRDYNSTKMAKLEFESPSNSPLGLFPVHCQFSLFYECLQSPRHEEFLAVFFTFYVKREFPL
jgi:hypothetical protein